MTSDPALLSVDGVSIHFGGIAAVKNVSFELRGGQILGLIGPNGAGKTTLFNIITRLYRPDAGRLHFAGHDLLRLRPHDVIGVGLARTFQNLMLFADMTALDNVMVGLHAGMRAGLLGASFALPSVRREDQAMRRRALDALGMVGLAAVAEQRVGSLPFGHQRLVELARALASRPKLLLLDEPGAGMNAAELDALIAVARRIHEDERISIFIIGHTMRLVFGISHHVIVLDRGIKICEGPPQVVRSDPRVIQAYLGAPDDVAAP
jgi:branched-chain amino acid transport system ATP-binding protein